MRIVVSNWLLCQMLMQKYNVNNGYEKGVPGEVIWNNIQSLLSDFTGG